MLYFDDVSNVLGFGSQFLRCSGFFVHWLFMDYGFTLRLDISVPMKHLMQNHAYYVHVAILNINKVQAVPNGR
jgi:hypothetical protein